TEARMDARDLSLDAPEHSDSDRTGLSRLATSERPADDAIAEQEIAAILRFERDRYRGSLSGRQRELFDARWLQESPPTLKAMGDRLGISRERARQIERQMLDELGTRVRAKVAA
ncbi:MAG: sigma factor-like helix-turn-helix DNA-binding protein, partial [Polyangia bacterium]